MSLRRDPEWASRHRISGAFQRAFKGEGEGKYPYLSRVIKFGLRASPDHLALNPSSLMGIKALSMIQGNLQCSQHFQFCSPPPRRKRSRSPTMRRVRCRRRPSRRPCRPTSRRRPSPSPRGSGLPGRLRAPAERSIRKSFPRMIEAVPRLGGELRYISA